MFAWQSNKIFDIFLAGTLKHTKITRNFFTAVDSSLVFSFFSIRYPKKYSILFFNSQKLRINEYQEHFFVNFQQRP